MTEELIKIGDFIIIKRQKYTKLHHYNRKDSIAALGKDQIELKNIENHVFCKTFKMFPLSEVKKKKHRQTLFSLEPCDETSDDLKEILQSREKGVDNRNIMDDGRSQTLTQIEIDQLRTTAKSSTEIVHTLIENSKTFNSKNEYAQEKYLKKKEKKYFEFVQIKKPTIRLLTEIFYRQDPEKCLGMRADILSQLISYSGVCSNGNYLVYESGTSGLVPAMFLNSIGANTSGQLVHMHPGNQPQKQAVQAMSFDEEQLNRLISVNIYSVLRHFYQESESVTPGKRKLPDENGTEESAAKIQKVDEEQSIHENLEMSKPAEIPKWKQENDKACKILTEKVDGLVVVAREHPTNIVKALLPFVRPSRPVVFYSNNREVLMELYVDLKSGNQVTGLRLVSNWMRIYQVLPMRTHPEMSMTGNSGFLLYGFTVNSN